jgi:hypothetical protein
MSVTSKVWDALASMIKLEDKVRSQSEAMKGQQTKIENLTERVIRLETQLDMFLRAAEMRRLKE